MALVLVHIADALEDGPGFAGELGSPEHEGGVTTDTAVGVGLRVGLALDDGRAQEARVVEQVVLVVADRALVLHVGSVLHAISDRSLYAGVREEVVPWVAGATGRGVAHRLAVRLLEEAVAGEELGVGLALAALVGVDGVLDAEGVVGVSPLNTKTGLSEEAVFATSAPAIIGSIVVLLAMGKRDDLLAVVGTLQEEAFPTETACSL